MKKRGIVLKLSGGSEGCGKTYLEKKIIHLLRAEGESVIWVANPTSDKALNQIAEKYDVVVSAHEERL